VPSSSTNRPVSDVIVVGGGHNALVCAAYLAEAGLSVTVLEGRDVIGGNTVTEELTLPGWQHDSCSTAHVVLQSNPLIRDDELGLIARYGLDYIVTDPAVVFPLTDGDLLTVHPDLTATAAEFARYSRTDADALVAMIEDWNAGQRIAHALLSAGLPLPDEPWAHRYERLRRRSAWDVIASTFHHPVVRRVMTWMALATMQPPERPGTGALPAAIMAGRLAYGWATPVGGSGALPKALAAHITDHGGVVETSAWVKSYLVERGRCVGVRTDDGREFMAGRAVVAGSHLRELAAMLETASTVADDAARCWRPGIPLFAVHFALRADASYRSAGGPVASAAGGLGSPQGLLRQVAGLPSGRLETEDPWLLMMSSTTVDPDRGTAMRWRTRRYYSASRAAMWTASTTPTSWRSGPNHRHRLLPTTSRTSVAPATVASSRSTTERSSQAGSTTAPMSAACTSPVRRRIPAARCRVALDATPHASCWPTSG
jgi:phytoene dehydrogenase-like protein